MNNRALFYLDALGLDPYTTVVRKKKCYGTGVYHYQKCGQLTPGVSIGIEDAVTIGVSIGEIAPEVGIDISRTVNKTVGASLPESDLTCCTGNKVTKREFNVCIEWDQTTSVGHWTWDEYSFCLPDPLLGSRCYSVSTPRYVFGSVRNSNFGVSFDTPVVSETGTGCDCSEKK